MWSVFKVFFLCFRFFSPLFLSFYFTFLCIILLLTVSRTKFDKSTLRTLVTSRLLQPGQRNASRTVGCMDAFALKSFSSCLSSHSFSRKDLSILIYFTTYGEPLFGWNLEPILVELNLMIHLVLSKSTNLCKCTFLHHQA